MLKFSIGAENPNAERTLVDITDEEKELFKYGEVRCFIRFVDDNTEMNESNYLKKVSFENLRYVPDQGFIGGAVAKRVTIELNNEDNSFNVENREFELFLGIVKDDGTTKYISYGNYIVQKPENDNVTDNSSIESYDYMIKFNKTYENKLNRMCTLLELFQSVCQQAGVETDVTSFRNSTFQVDSGMFVEGESLRDVLIAISQVAFTWARVGVDNKMYMDFEIKTTPTETLNNEEYYELSFNDDYTPLNKIVFATRDVEGEEVVVQDIDSINTYGENSLVIYDNPIAYTEEDRVTLIEAGKQLFGLTYKPLSMKTVGYVFLDETDFIAVTDMQGQTYKTYVFDHSFDYIGTITDNIESQAMTDNEVEYEFQGTLSTQLKKTQVTVDKANQKITLLTQQSEEFSETLTQLEINVGNIQTQVNKFEEFSREVLGFDQLELTNTYEAKNLILNLTIYGNTEIWKYLTPSETLVPSDTLVPLGDTLTLIIDNEERYNKTENAIEYIIPLPDEPLRDYNGITDELNIINNKVTITRRIGIDENGDLYILPVEKLEELTTLDLKTLKGTTYIYIQDYRNLRYSCKYVIDNDYVEVFATQGNLENAVVDLNSSITQTAEEINLEVSKKVGDDEIISKINQSAEEIQIDANKISLEGKEINLSSEDIIINSDKFSVDKNGNLTCVNASLEDANIIGRGVINIGSDQESVSGIVRFKIIADDSELHCTAGGLYIDSKNNRSSVSLGLITPTGAWIQVIGEDTVTNIYDDEIRTPKLTQTSLVTDKKNFEKLEYKALDEIKKIDIYKYHLKHEKDIDKKRLGFVIGENYNYSKEVTSNDNEGVDIYSFVSLCCKAIQELEEKVEKLEKEKEALKNGEN